MARFVTVDLPIGNPEKTLKLCKKVVEKDTAMGAGSPLTGFVDMADFDTKRIAALGKQTDGDNAGVASVSAHGEATKVCGISEGQNKQTEGTLYWYVLQVRDMLLIKNRGVEQNLEQWGYTVVISQTGARRNVRVEIPDDNPEDMTKLCEDILAKHTALGVGSPLTGNMDLTDFGNKTTGARTFVNSFETNRVNKEAFHGEALSMVGYSAGQTSDTEGTLYYHIIDIRDRLLQVNQTKEQNLELWGFKVEIREHNDQGKKIIFFSEGDVPSPGQVPINNDSDAVQPTNTATLTASGSPLRIYASETNNGTPGPTTVFFDVQPGTPHTQIISQLIAFIGLGPAKPFIMAQNIGATLAHYTLTIV